MYLLFSGVATFARRLFFPTKIRILFRFFRRKTRDEIHNLIPAAFFSRRFLLRSKNTARLVSHTNAKIICTNRIFLAHHHYLFIVESILQWGRRRLIVVTLVEAGRSFLFHTNVAFATCARYRVCKKNYKDCNSTSYRLVTIH